MGSVNPNLTSSISFSSSSFGCFCFVAMYSWRRQKIEKYKRDFQRAKSYGNRRPPQGGWQPTLPSWEEVFCSMIGAVPWGKVVNTKKYMSVDANVLQWDDSAGEDAFHNAKNRFWAELNDIPCDLSLPDPDIYIDEIDWDSKIDSELVLDLEREPIPFDLDTKKGEEDTIPGNMLLLNQPIVCTGWGDDEDGQIKATNFVPGLADCDKKVDNNHNPWVGSCAQVNEAANKKGWRSSWNNSWEDKNYNNYDDDNFRTGGGWGEWSRNTTNGEGNGWQMSRYKTSRFQAEDNYRKDNGWRNDKRRKTAVNHYYNKDRNPDSRQWKAMNSCQPLNRGPRKAAGDTWNWENAVS